jgi:hypothetical protein
VQRAFHNDGWKAVGTGLSRPSPPEIIKLDVLDRDEIEHVLDQVKYAGSELPYPGIY